MENIDKEIWNIYENLKNEIRLASQKKDVNSCLEKVSELWMFMNRFRNCDLQHYFDEEIYSLIANLKKPFAKKKLSFIKHKKNYRVAFIVINLNDLGGASIPHRFMLEKFQWEGYEVKNYFLITNFFKKEHPETDSFNYLKSKINPEEICFLSKKLT